MTTLLFPDYTVLVCQASMDALVPVSTPLWLAHSAETVVVGCS